MCVCFHTSDLVYELSFNTFYLFLLKYSWHLTCIKFQVYNVEVISLCRGDKFMYRTVVTPVA